MERWRGRPGYFGFCLHGEKLLSLRAGRSRYGVKSGIVLLSLYFPVLFSSCNNDSQNHLGEQLPVCGEASFRRTLLAMFSITRSHADMISCKLSSALVIALSSSANLLL